MVERPAKAAQNAHSPNDAIRVLQAKARLLTSLGRIAIWDVDVVSDVLTTSPELNKLLGFDEDATPTLEDVRRHFFPGEQSRLQSVARSALEQGQSVFEADFRYSRPDGKQCWFSLRAELLLDDLGAPARVLGTLTDITDRKCAEEVLHQSEVQKRAILDAALDAIITIDDRGQVVEWNRAAAVMFGRTADEVVGQELAELIIPPALRRAHRNGMTHFLKTGEGPVLGRRIEVEALGADGRIFPVELAISSMELGGKPHFTAYLRDLTSRNDFAAALRQSEERLRDITDALPILISYVDAEQRFQFVNKPYEAWFGRPRNRIVGRHLNEIMSPAVYEARRPYVERALRGEPLKYDMDMPREGGVTNTEIMHLPHRDESGKVLGMYAVVQDITARKQSEEALRASEKRFRQFADQNPAIIWSGDENGRLTYLSNRWYAYTGDNPSEPMPLSWNHVVHPDDQTKVHERWAEAKAAGGVYDVEARLRRHDGQYRWHSFRAEPLRDENGRINGWLGTNSDNHEAVERRNEQQRAHDRLWRLSQELMIVRDMQGVIVSANPSATRILGWAPEDMIGKSVYDFIHPDDIMASKATVTAQLSGSEVISVQNRYRCKDGSYRLLDWRGAASEGYVHAVGRDITAERQTAEELRLVEESLRQAQKMEAVGQLTGGIAHDFNNMLAGIIGSLDVLQRRLNSKRYEDTQRFIEAAITSANRAAGLTQRLLAFGRRQSLDVKALDVGPLVLSLEDLVRRTIGANVGLAIRLEPDLWMAKADANQLESAILNLVINARDAMSEGGTLTIEAENRTVGRAASPKAKDLTRGDYVVLSVTDNGEGMAPEVLDRAFEPFFTTKPIGQGTGLGLSMIFGLMRQIGGFTRIQSEVGIGTKVELYLPRASAEELEEHVPEPQTAPRGDGETVLVVEDDDAVRMLVLTVLQDLGYSALQVADAEAALPILESGQRIDLLVSDVGLPGMNGRQLAELARKRRPDLRVLFMSGYAKGAGIRSGFLEAGMEMMTKPFNVDELGTTIRNMLTGRA